MHRDVVRLVALDFILRVIVAGAVHMSFVINVVQVDPDNLAAHISASGGLDHSIDYFVVPPRCSLTGSRYEFSQTSELIGRAARSAGAWLSEGSLDHPRVHAQLSTHKHMH